MEKLKKQIQSKLDARKLLVSLNCGELLVLSQDKEKFDYFISGLAENMNIVFVCYIYPYFGVIKEMINNNLSRLDEDEELNQNVYKVLDYISRFDKYDRDYKIDFNEQYSFSLANRLFLNKLGISVVNFDKRAGNIFKMITENDIDTIKNDRYYLAVVSYLAKYYPDYLINSDNYDVIYRSISSPKREEFLDKNDYKVFKKVGSLILDNIKRYERKCLKEKIKEKRV